MSSLISADKWFSRNESDVSDQCGTFLSTSSKYISHVDDFYVFSCSIDVIVMTSLLSLLAVVGFFGNSLVIMVCWRYPTGKATQLLVLALSTSDLFVSAVVIPCRIITYHVLLTEITCKVTEGLIYLASHQSFYFLTLIAVDRYFAICKPTSKILTRRRAKILIFWVVLLAIACATPAAVMAGKYLKYDDNTMAEGVALFCFTGICNSDGTDYRLVSRRGVFLYSCIIAAEIICLWSTIAILYVQVFYALYRRFGLKAPRNSRLAMMRKANTSMAVFAEPASTKAATSEISRIYEFDSTMKQLPTNHRHVGDLSEVATATSIAAAAALEMKSLWLPLGDDTKVIRNVSGSTCVKWEDLDQQDDNDGILCLENHLAPSYSIEHEQKQLSFDNGCSDTSLSNGYVDAKKQFSHQSELNEANSFFRRVERLTSTVSDESEGLVMSDIFMRKLRNHSGDTASESTVERHLGGASILSENVFSSSINEVSCQSNTDDKTSSSLWRVPTSYTGVASIASVLSMRSLQNNKELSEGPVPPSSEARRKRQSGNQVSCGHTAKILLIVTLTTFVLYIPFVVFKLHLLPNVTTLRLIFFASSAANPIIYSVSSQQFRSNVRRLLRKFI